VETGATVETGAVETGAVLASAFHLSPSAHKPQQNTPGEGLRVMSVLVA
jgi:hypothetical protein